MSKERYIAAKQKWAEKQLAKGAMNAPFRQIQNGVPGRFLVAGLEQGVDRQGIKLRCCLLFLEQRPEDSGLILVQPAGDLLHAGSLSEPAGRKAQRRPHPTWQPNVSDIAQQARFPGRGWPERTQ